MSAVKKKDPNDGWLRTIAKKRPLTLFFTIAFAIGWPVLILPLIIEEDVTPSILFLTLFGLFGNALFVSALRGGRKEVKNLLSGVTKWRIGFYKYLFVLAALPITTLLVALVTGGLQTPESGWLNVVMEYLLMTIVVGALIINLWEETAWAGFVQSRLMNKRGIYIGSALAALPFIAIHLPLVFQENGLRGTTGMEVFVNLSALILTGFFFRYLAGHILLSTGGSTLAVGLFHASFNSSGSLGAVSSQWPGIIAMIIVALVVLFSGLNKGKFSQSINRESKKKVQI